MSSGLRHSARALALVVALVVTTCAFAANAAGAASRADDTADITIAEAGTLVAADFPAGFTASPSSTTSPRENMKLAKGVPGCGPYIALQKTTARLPEANSPQFEDGERSVSNEVDVFESEKVATAALARYAKPSITGCLENLFEKRLRRDPDVRDSVKDVVVTLERQTISGLGDDSVVYEGSIVLTGEDDSRGQLGIGSAAVRVGRAVDVVTYSTEGADLTELLTPAIDASVARLRAALARDRS